MTIAEQTREEEGLALGTSRNDLEATRAQVQAVPNHHRAGIVSVALVFVALDVGR